MEKRESLTCGDLRKNEGPKTRLVTSRARHSLSVALRLKGVDMKSERFILAVIVCACLLASCGISGDEKRAFDALERVRSAVSSGVNYQRYCDLVSDATAAMRAAPPDGRAYRELSLCLGNYQHAKDTWTASIPIFIRGGPSAVDDGSLQADFEGANSHLNLAYELIR